MTELPSNYELYKIIDLEKNRKYFWLINLLSLAIGLAMFFLGLAIAPVDLRELELGEIVTSLFVMIVGFVGYIFLHEGIHGLFIFLFSGEAPTFGFKGWCAYAGSLCFFSKVQYLVIALSPVVVWGIALFVLNLFCNGVWFWVVYFIQILNIGGAAGDYFVSVKMLTYPKDILVRDTGTQTAVFCRRTVKKEEQEEE